ncbi:MAG: FG-GAP-like repeat-containing protein [Acidobacteriota bacterium]
MRWSENDGTGTAWTDHVIASSLGIPYGTALGDVDHDGDMDVVVAAFGANSVLWIENADATEGGTWVSHTVDSDLNGAIYVHLADLDRDGDLDILAAGQDADALWWYENDGSPSDGGWTERLLMDSELDRPLGVASGDIDGDGDLDVVVAAAGFPSAIHWLENDGSPVDDGWTERTLASGFGGATGVRFCDLDRDGDLDLVASAQDDDELSWFENDGSPTDGEWPKHIIVNDFGAPRYFDCLDMDGDGDLDVTAAGFDEDRILVLVNDGSPDDGGWLVDTLLGNINSPVQAAFADLDNDGQVDVVASGFFADRLRWYRNQGGQFALPTAAAVASTEVAEGARDVALLRIDGAHRGRAGDGDAELATLELLFEQATDDALLDEELNALVDTLRLYLDDGDGAFDPALDGLFFSSSAPFSLADGLLTLEMVDGDPGAQMSVGSDVTWWLTADFGAESGTAEANTFQIIHITSGSSTGEMSTTDIPLALEAQDNVTSGQLTILAGPRVAAPIGDQTALEGELYELDIAPSFFEPEDEPLEFDASGLPPGFGISGAGLITGTADAAVQAGAPYSVTITASDPGGLTAEATFSLGINGIPDLVAPIDDATVTIGDDVALDVSASFLDPDGEQLTFEASGLPTTLTMLPFGVITGTPLDFDLGGAPYTVEVTAVDTNGLEVSDTFILALNASPDLGFEIGDAAVSVGVPVILDLSPNFDDPDGDTLTFTAEGLPASLSLSTDGVITGTPVTGDETGSPYTVTVTVTDPFGATAEDDFSLTVEAALFADGFESGDTSAWASAVP